MASMVCQRLTGISRVKQVQIQSRRQLFGFLDFVFNRVSKSRVAEVGADRACAEWLMRNGAFVRWVGNSSFVPAYNALPLDPKVKGDYQIAEVTADNASISKYGFPHFRGCNKLEAIKMKDCLYVNDVCLQHLGLLKSSLRRLEIVRCNDITEKGLKHLCVLENLQSLQLGELASVEDLNGAIEALKKCLPSCSVERL